MINTPTHQTRAAPKRSLERGGARSFGWAGLGRSGLRRPRLGSSHSSRYRQLWLLLTLLSCAGLLLTGAFFAGASPSALKNISKGAPEGAQTGMNAPFFALEPTSRLGTPVASERRAYGVAPFSAAFDSVLMGAAGYLFVPPPYPSRKPKLTFFQQLKLEGG